MALFHTTVVDNQIKALDTIGSVSGSIATFDTDRAERLVSCVCEVASGNSSVSVFVNSVNMWSETWEVGSYNNTGEKVAYGTRIRSVNKFRVKPNTTYYFHCSASNRICFYDSNGDFVSVIFDVINTTFTTPNNAYYMAFNLADDYGTTYKNDVSINNAESTTYQAFSGVIVDLGETLSGDGTLDVLSGILTRSDNTTKHVDGNVINAQVGTNNIYSDTGDIIDLKFILSVGKAIS